MSQRKKEVNIYFFLWRSIEADQALYRVMFLGSEEHGYGLPSANTGNACRSEWSLLPNRAVVEPREDAFVYSRHPPNVALESPSGQDSPLTYCITSQNRPTYPWYREIPAADLA
jgi:hypothetical protein